MKFEYIIIMVLSILGIVLLVRLVDLNRNCCMCGASYGCCPCPNYNMIKDVENYFGYRASGAGSWLYMCEEYKKINNETFECFEK